MSREVVQLSWGPVSYLEWANPGQPVVVLLHGAGYDNASLSWGLLGPELSAAGFHVIAPDHPGYGYSPAAPWPSTLVNLVGYVGEFVEGLGLRPYALGGLSMGGGIALGHALRQPRGLRALLLFGSYGLMSWLYEGRFAKLRHRLVWIAVHTRLLDALTAPFAKSRRLLNDSIAGIVRDPRMRTPQLMDEIRASVRPGGWRPFAQFQRDELRWNGLRSDMSSRLDELRVPTMLIHGGADTGVPVSRVRLAARRIPDARLLVVEGAGHWVQRDRPDIVNPAVTTFVESVLR